MDWGGGEPEHTFHKRLRTMSGGKESSRGMQHGTPNVEAPTAAGKGCLQPGPVRHGYTSDGLQGFPHGKVKVLGSFSEIGRGAGMEDIRDLRKGKADILLPTWRHGCLAALDVHIISPLQQLTVAGIASRLQPCLKYESIGN